MPNEALLDMQRIVRFAAEPRAPGDTTKAAIDRAARCLQLGYRRCYSFWHAAAGTVVKADEADRVRDAELRLIARERIRITQRMAWITARLDAKEIGDAHEKMDRAQNRAAAAEDRRRNHSASAVVGTEGVIADPRQGEIVWR